jgi:hypothetical protein
MDLVKQYIIQSISVAANNLRLNTQKIEVVALLREAINSSPNLENDIQRMKKITEFSKFAIRLNEIYNYLTNSQVDIFKLSDKLKEHSQLLIKDLSNMLDVLSPASFKQAVEKIREHNLPIDKTAASRSVPKTEQEKGISVDLSKRKSDADVFEKSESDIIKEKLILEEDKVDEDLFFQNYEEAILKPIKPLDSFLKQLGKAEFNVDELLEFAMTMKENGEASAKIGFDIIANMHRIIAKALLLINTRDLMPGREVIEAIRACLIVIVAVVRGKEVDITNYLNRAEEFGKKIQPLKVKEF